VSFTLDPSKAGPPGRGELRVAYAGSADTATATHAAEIERHTRVDLAPVDAEGDVLKPGAPEEGVAFVVAVTSPSGEVPSGSVEARVGALLVGAASVDRGAAKLIVTFAADPSNVTAGEVPIALRYAPSAPWFEPGPERTVRLPVRGPSPWRQIPLVLAGLAVIAWFVLARTARSRELPAAAPPAHPQSKGEAKVDVVRVARDPRTGWSGRVVDAHEGGPVANARVAIERPAFGQIEVVASVVANEDGTFELHPPRVESHAGDELVIDAPLHASLRQPVPPSGELDVALVLRKRAVVARLVAWTRQRGRPFDTKPEATPGHVRRHAGKDFNLARWADAVERAAFAGGTVDALTEREIDQLAPQAGPPSLPPSSPPLAAPMQQTAAAPTPPPKTRE
jgi:hypothetical protein